MKTNDFFDPECGLEEEAADWLLEREEGFAPDRAQAFAEWCERDPRHEEAVARVEGTLALLNEMPAVRIPLEKRVGRLPAKTFGQAPTPPVMRFNFWPWAAGLAAALVVGCVGWWYAPTSDGQTYVADAVEPHRIALKDGTVVDLNSNSRVQVRFSERERHVTLGAGEAHFQVAHNTARPFIVTAGGVSVRAVGTAFNVRLTGDKVDVIVTEGKVEVDREDAPSPRAAPILPLLVAGERIQISPGINHALRVEEVAPAAVHALLAWQDRMTSFTDVPLREMVARINRCNSTQLALEDPELGERKIGGVIALNQVDAFVRLLERDGDVVAERRDGDEILLRRAR
ncbi:MAG: FecR domain-containing protein [Opitutaceae bacterium]|jgi:transmembrane sensor